jgi:hypothetical protein
LGVQQAITAEQSNPAAQVFGIGGCDAKVSVRGHLMCEFCVQHGEGKEWYLEMRNYSRELAAQDDRPQFTEDTRAHFEAKYSKLLTALDAVRNIPLVYRFIRFMAVRRQKAVHWGSNIAYRRCGTRFGSSRLHRPSSLPVS